METLEYIASLIVRTFIPAIYVAKYLGIIRIYIGRFKLSFKLKVSNQMWLLICIAVHVMIICIYVYVVLPFEDYDHMQKLKPRFFMKS